MSAEIDIIKNAVLGDHNSQFRLGCMYRDGNFVKADTEKAIKWFTRASEGGHSRAKYELAELLYHSESEEAHVESFKLCRELVEEENNKDAMFRLYLCYRYAVGTKKDLKQAEFWVRKAIEVGHKGAVKELESLIH